jgi:hypothetical protein
MIFPQSAFRFVALLSCAGALQAQASVFRGPATGPGDILVFDAPGVAATLPSELQGITLLPVDVSGRATYTQFYPDQCRLLQDVPGASRVRLPHDRGSLYRYSQEGPGGTLFGYFIVHPDGRASHLASFPGTGSKGDNDPIPAPVSIDGSGSGMLVATTLEAGGDLFEITLATKAVRNVTADVGPIEFMPYGLTLLESWGAALTSAGPLRFSRAGGPTSYVVLQRPRTGRATLGRNRFHGGAPQSLPYMVPGFVKSADGSCVGLVAGESADLANVFVFGASGPAIRVNDQPAPMSGPGFLPAAPAGPTLALSPTGQRAAWKVNGQVSAECFSREVTDLSVPPEVQITGDAHFTDTLNDAGVISFFDPDSVVVLVGEANGIGGVEHADAFRASFAGGSMALTNLSQTSGETTAPFLQRGDIDTSDGIYGIPGRNAAVIFVSGSSGQGSVLRMDGDSGMVETLRTSIDLVPFVDATGSDLVLGLHHDLPGPYELLRVPFDPALPAVSLSTGSPVDAVLRHATSPDGYLAVIVPSGGAESLGRIFVPTGLIEEATTTPHLYGPTLGFDGSGAVLATVQIGGTNRVVAWDGPGGFSNYPAGGGDAFVLPGI